MCVCLVTPDYNSSNNREGITLTGVAQYLLRHVHHHGGSVLAIDRGDNWTDHLIQLFHQHWLAPGQDGPSQDDQETGNLNRGGWCCVWNGHIRIIVASE